MRSIFLCLCLLLADASHAADSRAANRADPAAAALIARYADTVGALHMAQTALGYEDNIAALLRETDVPAQQHLFASLAAQLQHVDARAANACQQLDLQRIASEIATNEQKLAVLARFKALGARAVVGSDGLHAMPLGDEWYRYFLRRWLGSDVTPAELMAFGKRELVAVLAHYRALQAQMGYAGRDDDFRAYLSGPQFDYPAGETPQRDYEARQATVYRHLDKLFLPAGIAPAQVRESTLGASFPADGYYERGSRTFYYNKATPHYGRRPLDFLTLHESTPGHHFQNQYAAARQACPVTLPPVYYATFAEGWSAYVEEFGAQLGLYRTPADELGAVEWELVRSIRVVLDVGINADGWTRAQALAYWHAQLPMLPALAEREVDRVRRWPVQAITYKYGADVIHRLRAAEQARLGNAFDIRRFHDSVLRNGPLPIGLLVDVIKG